MGTSFSAAFRFFGVVAVLPSSAPLPAVAAVLPFSAPLSAVAAVLPSLARLPAVAAVLVVAALRYVMFKHVC